MMREIRVGVRDLVGYVLRGGDLRQGFIGTQRAIQGIRGHQQIQRKRPSSYQAEVFLSHRHETADFALQISGRVDGLLVSDSQVLVEEIKTTTIPLAHLRQKQDPTHWGQVLVYAYIYALQTELSDITVRLTYFHLESEAELELERRVPFEELQQFYNDLLVRYLKWARTLWAWALRRDAALVDLPFPYAGYRPGQRHMAIHTYRRIRDGGHLMIEAPTGIGKTMGTLFPAAKAMGEGHVEKIFYLTARTTGRLSAQAAAEALNATACLKTLVLTAKEKICAYPESACLPEECPHASGHYDRVNTAIEALFDRNLVTATEVSECAQHYRVCPFELSLDLALWMDCIICDYNYIFDPRVRLRRFLENGATNHTILVDEAHNLVDRAREMFSAVLNKKRVLSLRRELKAVQPALYKTLGRINAWMLAARKHCDTAGESYANTTSPDTLYPYLRDFLQRSEVILSERKAGAESDALLEQYFAVHRFLRVAEKYDDAYRTCYHRVGSDMNIRLFCLDPASQLGEIISGCHSTIFFSATLRPEAYYRRLFGLPPDAEVVSLPSPFPPEHLVLNIDSRISTHYRDRRRTCEALAKRILAAIRHPGNHLIFFPSYAYLEMVLERLAALAPDIDYQVQTPEMSESERLTFLDRFHDAPKVGCVGMAVMGGIFGEGIDLVGERLIGAIVVGVGLPGIGMERNLIAEHFTTCGEDGFAFAYQYPGFTRVLQAVGRVIRTSTDRGHVLLIDRRYATSRYRRLMPSHWQPKWLTAGDTRIET
ncbi:MAG: ATP-dependent DNA helicase [Desulfosarcinaceae bacterium]|nr:ATP-dependent DNA helicase [Desulfosarcinaceae bacterium]